MHCATSLHGETRKRQIPYVQYFSRRCFGALGPRAGGGRKRQRIHRRRQRRHIGISHRTILCDRRRRHEQYGSVPGEVGGKGGRSARRGMCAVDGSRPRVTGPRLGRHSETPLSTRHLQAWSRHDWRVAASRSRLRAAPASPCTESSMRSFGSPPKRRSGLWAACHDGICERHADGYGGQYAGAGPAGG